MRAPALVLAALVVASVMLPPLGRHAPLDPDEPIAKDGSHAGGLARTIFDFEPVLGAFDEPKPPIDPDDPKAIREGFELDKDWTDRRRERIIEFLDAADAAFCDEAYRQRLITAIKAYYDARGRQKMGFSRRGPRAKIFIEAAWSTLLDQRIDAFVRRLVISGTVKPPDLPDRSYPEFAKVIGGLAVRGDGCGSSSAERK
jgi:hypothetical protein